MTKSNDISDPESVISHITSLDSAIRETVKYIRQIFLTTDIEIGERIKWNSPSFFYTGEIKPFNPKEYKRDIAVCNLHKNRIMLVFPSGSTVNDHSGLLEGDYKDGRRTITFKDLDDVKSKEDSLRNIIKIWIELVEK